MLVPMPIVTGVTSSGMGGGVYAEADGAESRILFVDCVVIGNTARPGTVQCVPE